MLPKDQIEFSRPVEKCSREGVDETAGLVSAEWEVTHDGAHRSIFNSHDALCVRCSRRFREETRGAASPILPEETRPPRHSSWGRFNASRPLAWAPHSRIPSGLLSHTNPNRSPSSIRHLSSLTENSLLSPTRKLDQEL